MDPDTTRRIERLESTLGTLISWLSTELGESNVRRLLDQLSAEPVSESPSLPVSQSPSLPVSSSPSLPVSATWWTGPAHLAKTKGVVNKNPLNIKGREWLHAQGTDDKGHAIFADPAHGVRAAIVNLRTYWNKHGLRTLEGIIGRWAPVTDTIGSRKGAPQNNPNQYAQWVAKKMGIGIKTHLGLWNGDGHIGRAAQLIDLISAMAEYEIGAGFTLDREVCARAILMLD